MNPIPTRFLTHDGTVAYLRTYFSFDDATILKCPIHGYHNAMVELARSRHIDDHYLGGRDENHPDTDYPTVCDCGYVFEATARRHILRRRLFVTAQNVEVPWEDLQPGDLFYINMDRGEEHYCHGGWTNCDGNHLHCMLPGDHKWDISGRASNCTMKNDTLHRCWVRHGDPAKGEIVHVDKAGNTCQAGAGSIDVPGWHGFLHNGMLRLA